MALYSYLPKNMVFGVKWVFFEAFLEINAEDLQAAHAVCWRWWSTILLFNFFSTLLVLVFSDVIGHSEFVQMGQRDSCFSDVAQFLYAVVIFFRLVAGLRIIKHFGYKHDSIYPFCIFLAHAWW